MSRHRIFVISGVGGILALTTAVALAAAPLPHAEKAYTTFAGFPNKSGIGMILIMSSSPKRIQRGGELAKAVSVISSGSYKCPNAKKSAGSTKTPTVSFGFPGATLKLSKGAYGFSVKETQPKTTLTGSSEKPFTLKVAITGKVSSSTLITGTIALSGGKCTTKTPIKYSAKLDSAVPVPPGA